MCETMERGKPLQDINFCRRHVVRGQMARILRSLLINVEFEKAREVSSSFWSQKRGGNMATIKGILVIATFGLFVAFFAEPPSGSPARAAGPDPSGGAEIYATNCAKCHGADGRAQTARGKRAGATDFTSDWNRDEARGIRIITNGKSEMPSFKKKLTAADIRAVFGYVSRF
jgi:mono/diheme cytochrome c family protein